MQISVRPIGGIMELLAAHNVNFNTRLEVPLPDIARSLIATDLVVKRLPQILEKIFPGLRIDQIQIELQKAESGSLIEDYILKIICEYQKNIEDFIGEKGNNLGIEIMEEKKNIISHIITALILIGVGYAISYVFPGEHKIHIEGDRNVVINATGKMLLMPPEQLQSIIETTITEKEKPRLAKEAVDFFAPAKLEAGASVTVGKDKEIFISPEAIKEIPSRSQLDEVEDEEYRISLKNTDIDIRVIDRDQGERGWKAIIPSLSKRRIRLSVVPTIDLNWLATLVATKGVIQADVEVDILRLQNGEERPVLIHLYNIHQN